MKLEELEKKYEELGAEIERLKEQGDKPFEIDDGYYVITSVGDVVLYKYRDDKIDRYRIATGNAFRTKEDAELYLEIQNRAIELRGDWRPDWGDRLQERYCLYQCHGGEVIATRYSDSVRYQGAFYMPLEAARKLIEEYGDKLKIWVCGGLS